MPIDPSAQVALTARVHPGASIGPGVIVGDFVMIEDDVTIGAGSRLEPYVYVKRWTTLGERNQISAGTVLGTDPLDKGFTGARSYLQNRQRKHHPRALHDFPRHGARVGDRHRRRELHHDLRPHCAQLPDREPHRDRQLRAGGRIRGGGGPGVHLRRRGDPPVFAHRPAGDDRRETRASTAIFRRFFSTRISMSRRTA